MKKRKKEKIQSGGSFAAPGSVDEAPPETKSGKIAEPITFTIMEKFIMREQAVIWGAGFLFKRGVPRKFDPVSFNN